MSSRKKDTDKKAEIDPQVRAIKLKLKKALKDRDNTVSSIHQRLICNADYNTVRETFDPDNPKKPNILVVLEIARIMNIDISSLFAEPAGDDEANQQYRLTTDLIKKGHFAPLDEKPYLGDFYGYMLRPSKLDEYVEFILKIYNENNATSAVLQFVRPDVKDYQNMPPYTFRGSVNHVTERDQVIMLLTAGNGNYVFLAMKYMEHTGGRPMYFRPGVLVTSIPGSHDVASFDFVLFKQRMSKDNIRKYIPGLANKDEFFAVEADVLEKMQNDRDVSLFLQEMSGYLPGKKTEKTIYWIKDSTVLSYHGKLNDTDMESFLKGYLKVKGAALEDRVRVYSYVEKFSNFARDVLQKDLFHPETALNSTEL